MLNLVWLITCGQSEFSLKDTIWLLNHQKIVAKNREIENSDPKSSVAEIIRDQIRVTKFPTCLTILQVGGTAFLCAASNRHWNVMNALLESGASVCEQTPVSTIHLLSSFICLFIHLQIIVNFWCSSLLTTVIVHVIVYSHFRYSYSQDFFNLFSFKFFSFFFC